MLVAITGSTIIFICGGGNQCGGVGVCGMWVYCISMERIYLLFLKLNVDILRECLLSAHGTYWDTTVLVLF